MTITLSHIEKQYGGTKVLRDFSARFIQGETVCVMGRSGVGKTTLAHILLGLVKADAGTVAGVRETRFSCAFQEDRLVLQLTALANLRFACGAMETGVMRAALAELGLACEDVEKPVHQLSGGQRRRVALCRAMLAQSDAVVLDEPFRGLDGQTRTQAAAFLKARQGARTLLVITHEQTDAAALGARVLYLGAQ